MKQRALRLTFRDNSERTRQRGDPVRYASFAGRRVAQLYQALTGEVGHIELHFYWQEFDPLPGVPLALRPSIRYRSIAEAEAACCAWFNASRSIYVANYIAEYTHGMR